MDVTFLTDFYMPLVLISCLMVGYCIKHIGWLDKISNQYIPTILTVLGAVLGCVVNSSISMENVVYGAFSGLASTGLHQVFKKIVENESGEN
ncbi:MAG: phage holin family protein [Lachnospiraceae bacterium]